jgi:hypothetical protein
MNPQNLRRAALVAMRPVQHALDETLLEFADRFVEQNSAIYHLRYQSFQLVSHNRTLRLGPQAVKIF